MLSCSKFALIHVVETAPYQRILAESPLEDNMGLSPNQRHCYAERRRWGGLEDRGGVGTSGGRGSVCVCDGGGVPFLLIPLTIVLLNLRMLNPDMPGLCKQCRFKSVVGSKFKLIWICIVSVFQSVCEFMPAIWIK